MHPTLKPERVSELAHRCGELVRRSVLTLAAVGDPDRRFLTPLRAVRQAGDDGWDAPTMRRFEPTGRDIDRYLDVLDWLAWLEREGLGREVKLLVARATGTPWWRLAERFRRSESTLKRWHAGAIRRLTERYWREIDRWW